MHSLDILCPIAVYSPHKLNLDTRNFMNSVNILSFIDDRNTMSE